MIQVTPTIWTRMADSSSDVEPTNWFWRLECPCDQLPYLRGFWTCRPIRWDPFPSSPKVISSAQDSSAPLPSRCPIKGSTNLTKSYLVLTISMSLLRKSFWISQEKKWMFVQSQITECRYILGSAMSLQKRVGYLSFCRNLLIPEAAL